MKKIVLLESHPLLRAGLQHVIAAMNIPAQVIALDSNGNEGFLYLRCEVDLLVLGIPSDWAAARALTDAVRERLSPACILLLCPPENAWSTAGVDSDDVYGCLPHDASTAALQAAVRFGLDSPAPDKSPRPPPMPPTATSYGVPRPTSRPLRPAAPLRVEGPPFETSVPAAPPNGSGNGTQGRVATDDREGNRARYEAELLGITPRQYAILVLLARGASLKAAARQHGISPATAKAHAAALYQRLGVHSKGEAVYVARSKGALL